jgi:3-methyladenine DNA glycosylase AlkD
MKRGGASASEPRPDSEDVAARIHSEVCALDVRNALSVDRIRRKYLRLLRDHDPAFVVDVALILKTRYGYRSGVSYELIHYREDALALLDERLLEQFGEGIDSWGTVDSFARNLSGPAWVRGRISDSTIGKWARSRDRWWRRAALVSTVALNVKASGGRGDASRTLGVCAMLVGDQDDMVVKALSWALRELVPHDPRAVRTFLGEHEDVLAARVKREVRNKLTTGLKNPRRTRTPALSVDA